MKNDIETTIGNTNINCLIPAEFTSSQCRIGATTPHNDDLSRTAQALSSVEAALRLEINPLLDAIDHLICRGELLRAVHRRDLHVDEDPRPHVAVTPRLIFGSARGDGQRPGTRGRSN